MHATDFEAVTYEGAVYCVSCLPDGVDVDDEEVSPIFVDSEWDHYPVCDACGGEHDYVSLTAEGIKLRKLARYSPAVKPLADEKTGDLAPYAWPGGYPMFYLDSHDSVYCPKCASDPEAVAQGDKHTGDNRIVAGDCNWEDPELYCDACNDRIESAYAEDDDDSDDNG